MTCELVEVSLKQRSQFALLVDSSVSGWDLDLEEDMIWTVDGLRPWLTTCTQVIVRTVAVLKIYMVDHHHSY